MKGILKLSRNVDIDQIIIQFGKKYEGDPKGREFKDFSRNV